MTDVEKSEFFSKYFDAMGKALVQWSSINGQLVEGRYTPCIKEVEAHPRTIDKVIEACTIFVPFLKLIDNPNLAENVMMLGVGKSCHHGTRNGIPL